MGTRLADRHGVAAIDATACATAAAAAIVTRRARRSERSRWSRWTPRSSALVSGLPACRWEWEAAAWIATRSEELRWLADAMAGAAPPPGKA
jgi:hypothetical protein